MPENTAQRPGDVEITKLKLISSSGDDIDIKDIFISIDIYEDIFENCISGAIAIADSLALAEKMPVIGNEKIEIGIKTPSLPADKQLRLNARIFKITDRAPLKDNTMGYVLHFTSPEKIYSSGIKISKAYKDMLLSDIAEQVYKDYLEPIRNKKIVVEPTAFTRSVLLPSWTPIYALNWLAKNCKAEQHQGASYVFYERRDAYIFTSLETLFKTPSLAKYFYGVKNTVDDKDQTKSVADFFNVEQYNVVQSPDTIGNIRAGMYSGKLISNDLVKRKIDTKYFNYADSFDDFTHLNKSKLTNSTLVGDFVTSHVTLLPKQFNAFGESDEGNSLDEVIMERKSQIKQIQNILNDFNIKKI